MRYNITILTISCISFVAQAISSSVLVQYKKLGYFFLMPINLCLLAVFYNQF